MDAEAILKSHYPPSSRAYHILMEHGRLVARKALEAAEAVSHLAPDREFIRQAAFLHDIGIRFTEAPSLGCTGRYPYICHGYLGRELLEKEGYPRHALVCERHVGVGLSRQDILRQGLPLPLRDMLPVTIEEQIICYADKFFSKNGAAAPRGKSLAEITHSLARHGADKAEKFMQWAAMFGATAPSG